MAVPAYSCLQVVGQPHSILSVMRDVYILCGRICFSKSFQHPVWQVELQRLVEVYVKASALV